MSIFSKIAGVINSFFQIGGPSGPGLNNVSSSVISATTSAGGTNYANVRGASPLVGADFVTLSYGNANYTGGGGSTPTFTNSFLFGGM
jgi:hypothetical protein